MSRIDQYEFAIECKDLHYESASKSILKGIDLQIPPGAVVGLVGANGCGKSTLLRSIVGLLPAQTGECRLLGQAALALDDSVRERLGYVAQSPDLLAYLSVEMHLKMIGQAYAQWTEERALRLAIQLQLPLGSLVGNLSGGDQQKLALILALTHQPDVIVLDEPVASLDPLTRQEFVRVLFRNESLFLSEIRAENEGVYSPTVLISSHLLSDLERIVTHIAFMRDGRIQFFDELDVIRDSLRILASDLELLPRNACVTHNFRRKLVDLRKLDQESLSRLNASSSLRTPTLDDLFVAFNE